VPDDIAIVQVPVDKLKPWPGNPRTITEEQLAAVVRSLKEFGFVDPIIVRPSDQMVIGGHQRLKAAKILGMTTVPVVYREYDDTKAKLLNIALNKTGGGWDYPVLTNLLVELDALPDIDITLTGFTVGEIKELQGEFTPPSEGLTDPDNVPEPPDEAITKPGDLWMLGNHRVLCGDSTKAEDVERLMDGNKADMVFTDPPYNINLGHIARAYNNYDDKKKKDVFRLFMVQFLSNALRASNPNCNYYVFHANRDIPLFQNIFGELEIHFHQWLYWIKGGGILENSDYIQNYEVLTYGYIGKHRFCGSKGFVAAEVFQHEKTSGSEAHPTSKPTALLCKYLNGGTTAGDTVLDLFLGSGSTLIACEKLNRICYGMEIDPHYCDVIIQRYVDFSGKPAKRESDGKKWTELKDPK